LKSRRKLAWIARKSTNPHTCPQRFSQRCGRGFPSDTRWWVKHC